MKKVMIFGVEGMLGRQMLHKFTKSEKFKVAGVYRSSNYTDKISIDLFEHFPSFDANSYKDGLSILNEYRPDVIINCAGIIKQVGDGIDDTSYFMVNSIFPRLLDWWASNNESRVIHFSTDCVFSGIKGGYTEQDVKDADDIYGLSKSLGEIDSKNSLSIRTSIIGFESRSSNSLLGWFFSSQKSEVNGYMNAFFSGVPTTYLANIVHDLIVPDQLLHGVFNLSSDRISKYDLLCLVNDIFDLHIEVIPFEGNVVDKSLNSSNLQSYLGISVPSWPDLIRDFKSEALR